MRMFILDPFAFFFHFETKAVFKNNKSKIQSKNTESSDEVRIEPDAVYSLALYLILRLSNIFMCPPCTITITVWGYSSKEFSVDLGAQN